jgi:hypothetical protein
LGNTDVEVLAQKAAHDRLIVAMFHKSVAFFTHGGCVIEEVVLVSLAPFSPSIEEVNRPRLPRENHHPRFLKVDGGCVVLKTERRDEVLFAPLGKDETCLHHQHAMSCGNRDVMVQPTPGCLSDVEFAAGIEEDECLGFGQAGYFVTKY